MIGCEMTSNARTRPFGKTLALSGDLSQRVFRAARSLYEQVMPLSEELRLDPASYCCDVPVQSFWIMTAHSLSAAQLSVGGCNYPDKSPELVKPQSIAMAGMKRACLYRDTHAPWETCMRGVGSFLLRKTAESVSGDETQYREARFLKKSETSYVDQYEGLNR